MHGSCPGDPATDADRMLERCELLPGTREAAPTSTAPGAAVTVSSAAPSCDLGYSEGHTYSVVLSNHGTSTKATNAQVAKDGSFSTQLDVPAGFPRGEAYVLVKGSTYDDCKDTRSCGGYATTIWSSRATTSGQRHP